MAVTMSPVRLRPHLDKKTVDMRMSGEFSDKNVNDILDNIGDAFSSRDVHWRNYGTDLRLGNGMYLVSELHKEGSPGDDSLPHCRGALGYVVAKVEGDDVGFYSCRRSKESGKEASYNFVVGKDNEPRKYKRPSDAMRILEQNVVLSMAEFFENAKRQELQMDKVHEHKQEKDYSLSPPLSNSRGMSL